MDVIVSVVIPVYNRRNLIKRSVESVLSQTYRNIEVIVVDDCSSDDTLDVLNSIKDERLKVFRNPDNKGANYSRNYGISKSIGKYIAFNDSDDVWKEDKLEVFVKAIEEKQCDVVFSGMTKYGKNYKRYLPTYNLNDYEDKYKQLLYQNCVSTQNLMVRKEVFEKVRFDEYQKKMQDWDLIIRIAKERFSIYYISGSFVNAYIQDDSITNLQNSYDSILRIYKKNKDIIENDDSLKIGFYIALGKASYKEREKSLNYFKKALSVKINKSTLFFYLIQLFHLYFIYTKFINIFRCIFSKLGLWKWIDL